MFGIKIISKNEYNKLIELSKMIRDLKIQLQNENIKLWGKENYDKINRMIDENPSISNKEILDRLENNTTKNMEGNPHE